MNFEMIDNRGRVVSALRKQRVVILVVAAIAAVLVAGCGGGGRQPAQQPTKEQPAAGVQTVQVKLSEFRIEPAALEARAGTVIFEVMNDGTVEHDFRIQELSKGTPLVQPGKTARLEVELPRGTYTLTCEVAGHKEAGMQMQLVVK